MSTTEEQTLWGGETAKAIENFPVSGERVPATVIHWLGRIKAAAARVNAQLGGLEADVAERIANAGDAIGRGEHDDQFPIDVFQTGSGTSSNMNANEVIANLAGDGAHANDHVNMGQSSNDVFPSAVHLAALDEATHRLLPALARLESALDAKADEFHDVVKSGRTHLMDAVPVTLGQEFSGYAAQIADCIERVEGVLPRLMRLAQGGTAVGTGLNAPKGFAEEFAKEVSNLTRLPFTSAPNKFAELAAHDTMVELSGVLNTIAVALTKIANDIRLLGSGPRCGLGELKLPENEPGSSIMPGKVNPTQCEMLTMVAAQVMGNHVAVTIGGMQGHLELNVFKPLIGANVIRSINLLATGMESFTERMLDGAEPDEKRIAELMNRSLMLVTALAPEIGYDNAAAIAKHAHHTGKTLKEAGLELGLVDEATFDRVVRAEEMIG
jgi:fumarate hydratase class II